MPQAQPQAVHTPQNLEDLTGTAAGRYTITALLGEGGMGQVYRAEDPLLKRPVALKRVAPALRNDSRFRERFLQEAERASAISHPNVATVHDVFEAGGELFLVLEFVEGKTLREYLQKPLEEHEFFAIALQCARGLEAAHAKGIVHRDIKPDNIMLTSEAQVKILDFGVARLLPSMARPWSDEDPTTPQTAVAQISGTPSFMAPEVLLEKNPDRRADIFSLGVVFYEALTGQHPFRAEGFLATCDRVIHYVPPPARAYRKELSPSIDVLLSAMLAKDPAHRYPSATALRQDIERLQAGEQLQPLRRTRWSLRAQALTIAAAALALILLVAGLNPSARRTLKNWFGFNNLPAAKHLAVLPFEFVSGDERSKALGAGIVATLTARLTQTSDWNSLQVVPPGDVRGSGARTSDDARRDLGANLVLTGSVEQSGDRVRLTYALVDPASRRQLQAQTVTASMGNPFDLEDQVVQGVLGMLELQMRPDASGQRMERGTQSSRAYESYLQGRGYLENYDHAENIESAITAFQRAMSFDQNYAQAQAGLGDAYWLKFEATREAQWADSAQSACEAAARINATLPAAHSCLGRLFNGRGDYEKAAAEWQRVLDREPSSDDALRGLAYSYERRNRPADAERTYQQAIAARPHYWAGYNWLGSFYYDQGHYADAAKMFEKVMELAPENRRGRSNLGSAYNYQGRYEEAIPVLQAAIKLRPSAGAYSNLGNSYFYLRQYAPAVSAYEQAVKLRGNDFRLWRNLADGYYWNPATHQQASSAYLRAIALAEQAVSVNPKDVDALGALAASYAVQENKREAQKYVDQALKVAPQNPEMLFDAALVSIQFGEPQKALLWLEKAVHAGYSRIVIRDTPNFEKLQSDPRFQKLIPPR